MLGLVRRTWLISPAQGWLMAALFVFFAIVYTQYAFKLSRSENGMRSAFLRWRAQLEDLDAGVNVWEKHAYPNPPIMVILLKPFLKLPPHLGASLWFAFKTMLALGAIFGVLSLLDAPDRPFPVWGKAIAVLMCLRPIEGDLVHGNINLLILFLIVAALAAFCKKRDRLAGFLIGLSIACKLTPALFLVYFAWKRAWAALFTSLTSMILFLILIPSLAYGWHNNLEYLQSWHKQMIAPYAAGIVSSEHKNQSLPGLLHRLLSDEASFSDYDGDRKIVLEKHNLASLDRAAVQGIVIACMALFAGLAAMHCRTSIEVRPRLAIMAEWSVVVLGMLLFCERTWKHHCVTLLLPFAVIAYCLSTDIVTRGTRWILGMILVLTALLMLSTSTGNSDLGVPDRAGKLAQVYGAYVWAFLLLLAAMFIVLTASRSVITCSDTARGSDHV